MPENLTEDQIYHGKDVWREACQAASADDDEAHRVIAQAIADAVSAERARCLQISEESLGTQCRAMVSWARRTPDEIADAIRNPKEG